jgi:nucleoid-associated protein YgaU
MTMVQERARPTVRIEDDGTAVVAVPVQIAVDAVTDGEPEPQSAGSGTGSARAARAARLGLGSAVLVAGTGGRVVLGGAGFHAPGEELPGQGVLDAVVGVADLVIDVAQRTGVVAEVVLAPVAELAVRPAARAAARRWGALRRLAAPVLDPLQERGRARRLQSEREAAQTAAEVLPVAMELVLDNVDITGVMLSKIDLAELIEATFDQVDVTEIALSKVDLERVLAASLEQLDLTSIAMEHVDLQAVVERSIAQVDVVALLRAALEGRDLTDLFITTPTGLAGEALRQTSRLVRRRTP